MCDDLNLLIFYITKDESLVSLALKIKHGLNSEFNDKCQYYKEPAVFEEYMSLLPEHVVNNINYIVQVVEISDVIIS